MDILLSRKEDLEIDKKIDELLYHLVFTTPVVSNAVLAVSIEQSEIKSSDEKNSKEDINDSSTDVIPVARKRNTKYATDLEKRYARFNACRSFPAAVYQKHINLQLIGKRATNGLLVVRPHETKSSSLSNTPIFISQVLVKIAANGNNGAVTPPSGHAPPFLVRTLPSEEDLDKGTILTPEVQIRRGPGRPYGSLTVKKNKRSHKDLSSGHSSIKDTKSKSTHHKKKKARIIEETTSSENEFEIPEVPELAELAELAEPDYELKGTDAPLVNVFDINSLIQSKSK